MDEERKRFEANFGPLRFDLTALDDGNLPLIYANGRTHAAWLGWIGGKADAKAQAEAAGSAPAADGGPTQEDIDKQWPGFTVTCKACGSTRITVEDSRGWSELSGGWGSVDWKCLGCGFRQVIIENG